MVKTAGTKLPPGTQAPDFSLPDARGKTVSLSDFTEAPALLVIFMCNHCPFVKHIAGGLAELARDDQGRGVVVVGINSNAVESSPDDAPAKMAEEVEHRGYTFPYVYDETQQVANSYRAACTPDFFLFDKDRKLVYRGQLDAGRPGNNVEVTGKDLRAALDAPLAGRPVAEDQTPSNGVATPTPRTPARRAWGLRRRRGRGRAARRRLHVREGRSRGSTG